MPLLFYIPLWYNIPSEEFLPMKTPKLYTPKTGVGRLAGDMLRRYYVHDVARDSAALTYYLLFALFPPQPLKMPAAITVAIARLISFFIFCFLLNSYKIHILHGTHIRYAYYVKFKIPRTLNFSKAVLLNVKPPSWSGLVLMQRCFPPNIIIHAAV